MEQDRLDKVLDELQRIREEDYPEQRILRLYGTAEKGIELDGKFYTLELSDGDIMFINHYLDEDGNHKTSYTNSIRKDELLDLIHLSII